MKIRKYFSAAVILISGITVFYFSGCNSGSNPIAPEQPVSFTKQILPIFAANCSFPGCHSRPTDNSTRLDLSSWQSLMIHGSTLGQEVIPYNAFWSHTVHHMNIDTSLTLVDLPQMPMRRPPYSGTPLPKETLELIMRWINEGAKNDNGEVAYSNITNKAFITNQAADLIAVVNLDNYFVTRLINTGGRDNLTQPLDAPHVVIVDNPGKYFYVTLIAEGYVEKFDANTYEKVGRMSAGLSPAQIVLNHAGTKGYYSNFDITNTEKNLKIFDTQTMTVTDTVSDVRMLQPHGLRLTHNDTLLVSSTEGSEMVFLISTNSKQILGEPIRIDPIVPPNGTGTGLFTPYQVAITLDDRYAFISCIHSNDVRVLDIQNRVMIQNIPVGVNPLALRISPDGRWCYVPNRNSNSVSVIDVASMTVIKTIPNVGAQPHMVDFTQDGHFALVTCESVTGGFVHHPTVGSKKPGTTAVIDVWNNHTKIYNIEMASFPAGICITPGSGN